MLSTTSTNSWQSTEPDDPNDLDYVPSNNPSILSLCAKTNNIEILGVANQPARMSESNDEPAGLAYQLTEVNKYPTTENQVSPFTSDSEDNSPPQQQAQRHSNVSEALRLNEAYVEAELSDMEQQMDACYKLRLRKNLYLRCCAIVTFHQSTPCYMTWDTIKLTYLITLIYTQQCTALMNFVTSKTMTSDVFF